MSSEFPKFVQREGSDADVEMILTNPESYTKLSSGILYEEIVSGNKGIDINSSNQQVTISYQHFQQDAKLIHREYFIGPLSDFSDKFNFKADFTEAMLGMKITGYRRLIIPPEINKTLEYVIVDVILENIKKEKAKEVGQTETAEIVEKEGKKNQKVDSTLDNIGSIIAATIGAAPVIFQVIREIKCLFPKSDVISKYAKTLPPNQWMRVGPQILYRVMDEGEGEVVTRYQQGCFEYKEAGSTESLSFEGSPTELAKKLCPGFDEDMLEAIVGMKLNARRIVFIPVALSGLGENTFLDLKLTTISDLNPRSRI